MVFRWMDSNLVIVYHIFFFSDLLIFSLFFLHLQQSVTAVNECMCELMSFTKFLQRAQELSHISLLALDGFVIIIQSNFSGWKRSKYYVSVQVNVLNK